MAVPASIPALLDSLTNALTSALEATSRVDGTIEPTENGVSLLDVKNELLLSYLQNLVFLILIKIRQYSKPHSPSDIRNRDGQEPDQRNPFDSVVRRLVELRLYLDKGVRPLEEKLHFQFDKILRAADDADRAAQLAAREAAESDSGSRSDQGSDGSDDSSDDSSDDGEDNREPSSQHPRMRRASPTIAAKQYAPNFSNFAPPSNPVGMAAATASQDRTGAYRPPKIAPTTMPDFDRRSGRGEQRRPLKSAAVDEYVSAELSTAPLAEPSVGTTIVARGRKVKTASERHEEDRRREYEESNFVRLPKESKKERAKRSETEARSSKMTFGGEDWRDLDEGANRIERLTRRKESSGGTKALLEKSRKRVRETVDGGRGSGLSSGTREIGDRFNKRLKVIESGRRDRGKR
ncbi:hypothetical protein GGS23DRAFT_123304 [Durotheca rogersii]|uniref:uncharacterized protein n=1 Tax=Durotheca rogersii TaxID=419775 RepID=UPI00221FD505|nr:uncharacterized protein GGS23DRAFT_123304 [Durotheca rogersii]KAI5862026.1 hypothetical protein GGS23DRAFT_123304 [Durotheca rogersii]